MTCGGKTYNTVKIGEQVWMAENLNYNIDVSRCYDNSESNCDIYGRLYNWSTAMEICPSGWHLPSDDEWVVLVRYADGASYKLKATGDIWASGNGTDDFGFNALPGGWGTTDDYFSRVGGDGSWWTATEINWREAVLRGINSYSSNVTRIDVAAKSGLYSVRCIKD
jgi:uncharacterized protein (TIGR02145 family)